MFMNMTFLMIICHVLYYIVLLCHKKKILPRYIWLLTLSGVECDQRPQPASHQPSGGGCLGSWLYKMINAESDTALIPS